MLLTIALILFVLWALGFFAFHVAGGLIHLLLIIAVIVVVLHLVRGAKSLRPAREAGRRNLPS